MRPTIFTRVLSPVALFRNRAASLSVMLLVAMNGCSTPSMGAEPPLAVISGGPVEQQGVAYWPITLEATGGRIGVYQPQPESLKGDVLSARAAVSLRRPVASAPTFCAAWFTPHVETDRGILMVTFPDFTLTELSASGSTP